MVDKTKLKSIWTDPVWSKVIAAIIITILGLVITRLLNIWPIIGSGISIALGFLGSSTPISNWLFGLFIICTLLVILILGIAVWRFFFPPNTITWRNYIEDTFMGLRWYWQYTSIGDIYNLYCCCPNCQYQVYGKSTLPGIDGRIVFRCDYCGTEIGPIGDDMNSILSKVERLIQQKIRNGSWANVIAS